MRQAATNAIQFNAWRRYRYSRRG